MNAHVFTVCLAFLSISGCSSRQKIVDEMASLFKQIDTGITSFEVEHKRYPKNFTELDKYMGKNPSKARDKDEFQYFNIGLDNFVSIVEPGVFSDPLDPTVSIVAFSNLLAPLDGYCVLQSDHKVVFYSKGAFRDLMHGFNPNKDLHDSKVKVID